MAKTNEEKLAALQKKEDELLTEINSYKEKAASGKVSVKFATDIQLDLAKKLLTVRKKIVPLCGFNI